jgi:hypothetical protein
VSYKCVGIFKKSNDLLNLSTEVISFISLSNLKQSFNFILTPNFNQKNIFIIIIIICVMFIIIY